VEIVLEVEWEGRCQGVPRNVAGIINHGPLKGIIKTQRHGVFLSPCLCVSVVSSGLLQEAHNHSKLSTSIVVFKKLGSSELKIQNARIR